MNRKVRWRFAALFALAVLVTAVVGVTAGQSARGSHDRATAGVIIDGTTDTVTNIDPAGQYDFGSGTVDYQIFNRLLEAGPGSLTPRPVLASACGFKGNLTTYSCTLRKGVKFHNGDEMTSADVKWSFDRVVKIKDPSGIYTLLSNMKSIATNGKYGVTFHLKTPQSTWPNILTTTAAQIVPKSVYPANKILPNSETQVGTGPYRLTKYQPGQQAVFEPNGDFFGKKPANDGVIIRYYSKSSTMKLALQRGEIDMAFRDFTPTELLSLTEANGIKVHKGSGASIRYLVLNTNIAPTDNPAVRKAIAYLFPRATIASRVYHGLVKPLYSMVPAGLPGHTDAFATVYGRSPSVAKAKAVLAKGGVSTPVNLELWYTPTHDGDSSADEFAEIQRALNASGLFKVTLKSAEWAQYSDALGKQYGAFQLGWFPDYVDAENYLLPFYESSSNFTSNNYKSGAIDALLKREKGTKGLSTRLGIVRAAQLVAAKDAPIIPYWQGAMIAVSRSNVKGVDATLDPTFIMRFWLISK
jgi:peptide/nickel transport system substrate-binding protein